MEKKKPAKKETALHGLQAAGGNAETPAQHPDAANRASPEKVYPVIGIGASAGGLEAIEEFFHSVPDDSGMAFVVVSHTDPARASLLPDIIQRKINIPVILVEEGMNVEPNTVYLPPSNRDLILEETVFRLKEQQRGSIPRLPIDTFLKSLAGSRGERAGCIILSGTGSDGTHGLRFIKESSGVTMVQSRDSARYEGMPESAIGTGMADYVLRPSEMPKQLVEYFSHDINLIQHREIEPPDDFLAVLSKIVITINNQTGHDFSQYKKNTLVRRIQRRMSITHTESPEKYLGFLHRNPAEIGALFQDLLIGVTSFFRDPEAFNFLKNEILPDLLTRKDENLPFRVWIPGCSTGEEVYSVVMLLQEVQEELNIRRDIQVFGTDIDRAAIEKAREGLYPQTITADVSEKRIKRFFEKDHIHYRVRKGVRESVVFAVQNLLKDPPFSRLDLLVCRNLLIYLEAKAQKRLLPLFHYALKPGGVLFLGSSETVGDFTDLFIPLQKKWNFYRKVDVSPALQLAVHFPIGGKDMANALERARTGAGPMDASEPAVAQATEHLLLENHTPACVVVNRRGEINYVHGRTGKFLEPAQGRMSVNIVDMAREGVRFELAAALRKVASSGETVTREGLGVKTNGDSIDFNLMVKPMGKPESLKDMIVVLFEEIPVGRQSKNSKRKKTDPEGAGSQRVTDLEREMAKVQQDHRTAMEELETSNEELKSVNEELQSSNEELESSREELQSLNEELTTVNAEHHDKITELSQAYDSITHVLNCTRIAIVFVDNKLNVMRFTQEATRLINLIDADIGRPLTHISTNLEYPLLLDDIKAVISNSEVLERQVITKDGHRHSMRIVPYRDWKGRKEGAILTFINADGWPGAGNSCMETGGADESITTT